MEFVFRTILKKKKNYIKNLKLILENYLSLIIN